VTLATIEPVQMLRHQHGAWTCAALPTQLDSASTLVVACGTGAVPSDRGPMHELRGAFRSASIIGCSTSMLTQGEEATQDGVIAMVWRLRKTRLSMASAPLRSASDSFRAGQLLGQQLMTPSLRGIILLSDGQRTNGTQMLRGLHTSIGDQVCVVGGLSGHEAGSDRHWVLRSGIPMEGFASAVGLYGSAIRFVQSSQSAWDGVGPLRRITRARDHTVFELDGRPAWDVYREYLGKAGSAWAHRLPLRLRLGDHQSLRTVRHVDESNGAITFAGDMPEGTMAQFAFAPATDHGDECGLHPHGSHSGLRLECIGEVRGLVQDRGVAQPETDVTNQSDGLLRLGIATSGEFARVGQVPGQGLSQSLTQGHTELLGGSVTTTSIYEEEQ
jgi:hypothetical protein